MTALAAPAPVADPRWRTADVAWAVGLALYTAGALYVLGQGLLAAVSAMSPGLHEAMHVQAIAGGVLARTAQRVADATHVVGPAPQVALDFLASLVNLGLAVLVLWLRPRDRTARLLALALVGAAGVFNLTSQEVLEQLPMTPVETTAQGVAHVVAGLAYVLALVQFPDGRLVPRWRVRWLVPLYLPLALGAVLLALGTSGTARPAVLLLFFGLAVPVVGALAQLYRLRRAAMATEQAQARLLFWSLLPALGVGVAFVTIHGIELPTNALAGRHLPDLPVAAYRVFQVVFGLIPLALFAGLVRYRLWDIERIVNRTVVYAIVTVVLAGCYAAFVVVAQVAVGSLGGQSPLVDSKPAVAVSTLVLAAAFRPLRDRVQTFVDRRFNRSRYDALITVERFGGCVRDEVSLDSIAVQLTSIVDEVLQPREVSLWVRSAGSASAGDG